VSLPYYKRYPNDFLTATIGLSLMEKGAYSILLDLMYARDGAIPDDRKFICGVLGCTSQEWTKIKRKLEKTGKIAIVQLDEDDEDSRVITNKRAEKELESRRKYSEQQSENRAGSSKNKYVEKPSSNHTDTEQNRDTGEGNGAQAREPESVLLEADCRKWANGSLVANFEGTGLSSIERLMKPEAGGEPCTRDDVRVGITETASTLHSKGKQVASLEYFEQPILRARDKRLSPLPKVEIIDERAGSSQSRRNRHAEGSSGARSGNQHRGNGFISGLALLEGRAEAQDAVPVGPEDWRSDRVATGG